jgi:hypothetical protein
MKKKKLIVVFILIILLFIITLNFLNKSFADETPAAFKLNQVETKVGDVINVELILQNERAFLSSDFVITYDVTKLNYLSFSNGNIQNFTIYANESSEGTIKIAGIQDPAQSRVVSANTILIVLQFEILSGRGTQTNLELDCESLYTSETVTAETIQTSGVVDILNTSGLKGNIVTTSGFENMQAFLYNSSTNLLVDELVIGPDGMYNLDATAPGEYYIKIKKYGYLDYFIRGIIISEINNEEKTINNIDLLAGDLNNDGEIDLLDLVKINDNFGNTTNEEKIKINISGGLYIDSTDKQILIQNYNKKYVEKNINDIGYNN